jgi:hypothetical protein
MVDIGGRPAPTPFPFPARTAVLATRVREATSISLFRLSKGRVRGTMDGAPVILLTTSGRKTGARVTRALVAFEDGITWIVAEPRGAANRDHDWYENLVAYEESQLSGSAPAGNSPLLIAPEVEFAGNRRVAVRSQVLTGEERAKWWARMVEMSPRLAAPRTRAPHLATPVLRLTPLGF